MNKHEARMELIERRHREEFREFYLGLSEKEDVYYLFFTTGLLHWVLRALSFVPRHVNVVIIGSDLTTGELEWVRENISRPFHHIRLLVDDKTVWEFLFDVNEHNFGWMDIDCFVINPNLFDELSNIDPGTCANCVWTFPGPEGLDILQTYLLFVNHEVFRRVNSEVLVSPCTYSYEESQANRMLYAYCRVISPEIEERLGRLLPIGENGRPVHLSEVDCYDTLQVYQLVAQSFGYPIHKTRGLVGRNSDEVIHVGKVSYYNWSWKSRKSLRNQKYYGLVAQADYQVLSMTSSDLPEEYRQRLRTLTSELAQIGISTEPAQIRENLCQALKTVGVSRNAAAELFV